MCGTGMLPVLVGMTLLAASAYGAQADSSPYGAPEVTKFRGGRSAAFCMQFDDSMDCQAEFCIPEMNKRGLVGTFLVNPALDRHNRHKAVWEEVCPKFGHELANHTMHHQGANDDQEADYEIGECSRYIWKLYPDKSKLRPYLSGGGTTWNVSREVRRELSSKYFLFRGFGGPGRVSCAEERGNGQAVVYAQEALKEGKWSQVGFHGVGEGWIITSREHFTELLDFLAANRDKLWVATTGSVYKYTQLRDAVKAVILTDATEAGFHVAVECDPGKVETYGRPLTELYDEPLTVRVRVPDGWTRFAVKQGDAPETPCETVTADGVRYAVFDVLPNVGPATVTRAAADEN